MFLTLHLLGRNLGCVQLMQNGKVSPDTYLGGGNVLGEGGRRYCVGGVVGGVVELGGRAVRRHVHPFHVLFSCPQKW